VGVGAAMTGLAPLVDIMFGDFITLTMDQMVIRRPKSLHVGQESGKSDGDADDPGRDPAFAAQHSQSAACVVQSCSGAESRPASLPTT